MRDMAKDIKMVWPHLEINKIMTRPERLIYIVIIVAIVILIALVIGSMLGGKIFLGRM
jgi:hypothetical protein